MGYEYLDAFRILSFPGRESIQHTSLVPLQFGARCAFTAHMGRRTRNMPKAAINFETRRNITINTPLKTTPTKPAGPRRLNLILSDSARRDLDDIANKTRRSLTEVVRLGLGLVRL